MFSNTLVNTQHVDTGFINNDSGELENDDINIEEIQIANDENQTNFVGENTNHSEQKPYFLNRTMKLVVNSQTQNTTRDNSDNENVQNENINNEYDNEYYRQIINKFDTGSIIINDDTSCDTLFSRNYNDRNTQTSKCKEMNQENDEVLVYQYYSQQKENDVQLKPKEPSNLREKQPNRNDTRNLCINENIKYTINMYNNNAFDEYVQIEEANVKQLLQLIPQLKTLELDIQTLFIIDNITINRLLEEVNKIWNEIPKQIQRKVSGIVYNYNEIYSMYDPESMQIVNTLFKEYLVQIIRKLWKSVGFNWKNFYHQWSNHFIDIYDSYE